MGGGERPAQRPRLKRQMPGPVAELEAVLARNGLVLLDGGTGTELERRGAPMSEGAWCGLATLSHPEILRQVHLDFLAAGADVIIANTYASARHMMEAAGRGADTEAAVRQAVAIALEARAEAGPARPVAVAGSLSTMRPIRVGADNAPLGNVPLDVARRNYAEIAGLLADAGVDLIVMEMMGDRGHAGAAVEAAVATGLPVWVGFSCRVDDAGEVRLYRRENDAFAPAIPEIMALGGSVAGVMHTPIAETGPALEVLRRHWPGPIMAYPESGHFEMPHWCHVDIIAPADFVGVARGWIDAGVRVIGGCCGMGPDHIRALAALKHEAQAPTP